MAIDPKRPPQKEDDIAEVRREEMSRGAQGPASLAAKKRQAILERRFRKLLGRGTEADFYEAMRAVGVKIDSPEFRKALQIWREHRLL